ncbi:30S ribosomal protein S17 [Candidatus Bipolaricaulota bacterium]|nr:30S ribosomal protein S17 [Candidatus Bipolaricaulota bacterium]
MRKQRIGRVISDRMQKTIVVVEERLLMHPRYRKYVRRRTTYYVHDEREQARVGDIVRIEETRPLSRLKRWRLVGIVRRSEG